jgi:hypothetical protein
MRHEHFDSYVSSSATTSCFEVGAEMLHWDSGATLIVIVTGGLMLWARSSENRRRIEELEKRQPEKPERAN